MLICFEGTPGVGKTTQCFLLKERIIKEMQLPTIVTKALDVKKKRIIHGCLDQLHLDNCPAVLLSIFLLGFLAQYQNIQKAFEENKIVIADRWKETFHFYNDYFGPLASKEDEQRKVVVELATGDLEPDITVVIDMDPKFAESNCLKRGKVKLDREKTTWTLTEELQKAREYYFQAGKEKKNWVIIDGTFKSIEVIHEEIWEAVSGVLQKQLKIGSIKTE